MRSPQEHIGREKWASLVGGRGTVLLLGDSLGDATMADEMGMSRVAKIGFLNESAADRVASRLVKYRRAFDAVILGDISMEWIRDVTGL